MGLRVCFNRFLGRFTIYPKKLKNFSWVSAWVSQPWDTWNDLNNSFTSPEIATSTREFMWYPVFTCPLVCMLVSRITQKVHVDLAESFGEGQTWTDLKMIRLWKWSRSASGSRIGLKDSLPLPDKANLCRIRCWHLANTIEKIDTAFAKVYALRVPF